MSFSSNFRGRGAARPDGPNGLVCNQNTGELVRGQRARAAGELAGENLFSKASVTVLLGFSQANDGSEAGVQGYQWVFGDVVIGFTKKLAALGVADDDAGAACSGEH